MLEMIAEPCDFALQFAGMDRVSAPGESATLGRVSTPESDCALQSRIG